ncbi:MAG: acylphosphatase [Chryseolinea sp.]
MVLQAQFATCLNGSVQIEVEGEQEVINKFYAWCLEGPPRAVVNSIDVQEGVRERLHQRSTIAREQKLIYRLGIHTLVLTVRPLKEVSQRGNNLLADLSSKVHPDFAG